MNPIEAAVQSLREGPLGVEDTAVDIRGDKYVITFVRTARCGSGSFTAEVHVHQSRARLDALFDEAIAQVRAQLTPDDYIGRPHLNAVVETLRSGPIHVESVEEIGPKCHVTLARAAVGMSAAVTLIMPAADLRRRFDKVIETQIRPQLAAHKMEWDAYVPL
jgi:hypothetical protein